MRASLLVVIAGLDPAIVPPVSIEIGMADASVTPRHDHTP
jgi:hypothetical protein